VRPIQGFMYIYGREISFYHTLLFGYFYQFIFF